MRLSIENEVYTHVHVKVYTTQREREKKHRPTGPKKRFAVLYRPKDGEDLSRQASTCKDLPGRAPSSNVTAGNCRPLLYGHHHPTTSAKRKTNDRERQPRAHHCTDRRTSDDLNQIPPDLYLPMHKRERERTGGNICASVLVMHLLHLGIPGTLALLSIRKYARRACTRGSLLPDCVRLKALKRELLDASFHGCFPPPKQLRVSPTVSLYGNQNLHSDQIHATLRSRQTDKQQ